MAILPPYREGTTSGVYRLSAGFGGPVVASEVGDLRGAVAGGTAFSLAEGDAVVGRFEEFVRAHRHDLPEFTAAVLARMDVEKRSLPSAGPICYHRIPFPIDNP